METKNIILNNYVVALASMISSLENSIKTLTPDSVDENLATLRTINVILESVRVQTVNIQNAVDNYGG